MLKRVVQLSSKISELAIMVILMLYSPFKIHMRSCFFLKPFLVKVLGEWNTLKNGAEEFFK